MGKHNLDEEYEYGLGWSIFFTVLFACSLLMFYSGVLFRTVGDLTHDESLYLLWFVIVVSSLLGIACHTKGNRNMMGSVASALMGYGIYSLLAYGKTYSVLCIVICGITAVGFIINIVLVYKFNNYNLEYQEHRHNLIKKMISNSYNIVAYGLGCLVLILGINSIVGLSLLNPSEKATKRTGDTIEKNIKELSILNKKQWDKASVKQRINLAQTIVNIESEYLGLSHPINVGGDNLKEHTLALYSNRTKKIMIDINHLEKASADDFLESVLHESYHACQDEYVAAFNDVKKKYKNNFFLKSAKKYSDEFKNYKQAKANDTKSLMDYYWQDLERDARSYSKQRDIEYEYAIKEYNKKNKK